MHTIRLFMPNDYQQILDIWEEAGLGNPERGDNLQTIERTISMGGAFFVMEHQTDQSIIGTSWITNDGRRLYLHHFGIKKEYRGQKLAKPLLVASLAYAKQLNFQIKLEVHNQNKTAINLYQKAGFKSLGDYRVFIIRQYTD
ncbi:MAG: GNAT family N-acetyltransferase [Salinivirgaceae bacterium]